MDKDESGKYIWGAAEESTLEGLKLYSQAYREGLINPDFFALKNQEEVSHYESGIAGVIFNQGFGRSMKLTSERYATNSGDNPKTDLHMAYLVGDDGKYYSKEISNYWTASIFSPTMEDAKFERLMDLLEYSASDEGQNLIRMGFEGKDWERGENGDITILREKDSDGNFVNLDTISHHLQEGKKSFFAICPIDHLSIAAASSTTSPTSWAKSAAFRRGLCSALRGGHPAAGGQLLLDPQNPTCVIMRTTRPFIWPTESYDIWRWSKNGKSGNVFLENLVYFKGRYLMYYGAADHEVAIAATE